MNKEFIVGKLLDIQSEVISEEPMTHESIQLCHKLQKLTFDTMKYGNGTRLAEAETIVEEGVIDLETKPEDVADFDIQEPEEVNPKLEMGLEELGLDSKTCTHLKSNGVNNATELCKHSRESLGEMSFIGPARIGNIEDILHQNNMSLSV